jgi:hypothetical protein
MKGLSIESELSRLERQKKDMRIALMKQQQHVAKRKACDNHRVEQKDGCLPLEI